MWFSFSVVSFSGFHVVKLFKTLLFLCFWYFLPALTEKHLPFSLQLGAHCLCLQVKACRSPAATRGCFGAK